MEFKAPVEMTASETLKGVWDDFINSVSYIDGGYSNKEEMISVLSHNMVLMHKLLLSSGIYRGLVNSSFSKMMRTKYWGSRTIHEDELGKVGLLSIYKGTPVPLHDHPGARGVLMVLDGKAELERYNLMEKYQDSQSSGLVEMESCERRVLKPFDVTWFEETEGNIHGFEAKTDQCVLLKIQMPVQPVSSRSWYFPTCTFSEEHETVYARRIMSRYL